jgi:hypothetical protein
MELHPMPAMPPMRMAQLDGDVRAVVRNQPRTVAEILTDARREMELEDAYVAWLEGKPLPPRIRHPRRTLRMWLTGRGPEPAPLVCQTEVVPVFRG